MNQHMQLWDLALNVKIEDCLFGVSNDKYCSSQKLSSKGLAVCNKVWSGFIYDIYVQGIEPICVQLKYKPSLFHYGLKRPEGDFLPGKSPCVKHAKMQRPLLPLSCG